MKQIIYLIFFLLIGCSESRTDFVVKLTSQDGYGTFTPGNVILWPSIDSLFYQNVPSDIDEFVVRSIPLQREQYLWSQYLDKKIEKEQFEKIINHYKIDTTKLSDSYIDCEVLFLIGTKSDKRIIIVDSDNDEDFGDEKVLEYEYPLSNEKQKELSNSLPIVSTQYDYFENGKKSNKKTNIKPSPYKGSLGLAFNTDNQIEKKYYLFASFPEHKKGEVTLNDVDYGVLLSNGFSRISYPADNVSIFITSKSDSIHSEIEGDIPYGIGDIFNVKGRDYLIDSISKWGEKLFINYIGENTKPVGITEGFFMPKFEAKHLDNSIFELKQHPDKFILLDFWGTWCNPCIKFIPELKKIKTEFNEDKFVLVSVAYDRDSKKVKNFVDKENMNWEHVFVNQTGENKNSLIEKLKVNSYPTTILIAPDGKIVARNKTMDEIREILKNAL
jgi:thiol-disulfide isomerase/thioredoxin